MLLNGQFLFVNKTHLYIYLIFSARWPVEVLFFQTNNEYKKYRIAMFNSDSYQAD